jgi:hypothetical protein
MGVRSPPKITTEPLNPKNNLLNSPIPHNKTHLPLLLQTIVQINQKLKLPKIIRTSLHITISKKRRGKKKIRIQPQPIHQSLTIENVERTRKRNNVSHRKN